MTWKLFVSALVCILYENLFTGFKQETSGEPGEHDGDRAATAQQVQLNPPPPPTKYMAVKDDVVAVGAIGGTLLVWKV
jgi:hypothetical protein